MTEKASPPVAPVASSVQAPKGNFADLWLGLQVRTLRQAKRLSLKQLADQIGTSIGMLSQIERGISSPSIKSLREIAEALAVPVMYFFRGAEHGSREEMGRIVRAKGRRILRLPSRGVTKELVTPDLSGQLELLLVIIEPGGSSGGEFYTHKGEEAGYVISGSMQLHVSDQSYVLHEGDSFRFESTIPHRFESASSTEARVLWVTSPPIF